MSGPPFTIKDWSTYYIYSQPVKHTWRITAYHIRTTLMNIKELQEFIRFIISNKSLTAGQKTELNNLLARDFAKMLDIRTGEQKKRDTFKPLSPLNTAQFFKMFNDPMALKFLTHDFDVNDDERPHTMPQLITQISNILKQKDWKIPASLWNLITHFIHNGGWLDTFGERHTSFFTDNAWVRWSEQNKMHPINNPDYRQEIMAFRSTIRLVQPSLQDIVDRIKPNVSLNITTHKLEAADFYTNTYILNFSIKRILGTMNVRSQTASEVIISYGRNIDKAGRMKRKITITQKGSFAIKSLAEVKSRLDRDSEAGDFGALRKMLNGYCLWSVSTLWDGEPKKWNILQLPEEDETEAVTGEVAGFTHELEFYIV